MLSIVFHFANGLWTAAITWGLTVSATAQTRWGYACFGLGVGLAAAAVTAIYGFATLNPAEAEKVEIEMRETPVTEAELAMEADSTP